jgi:hypothetical protein
MRAREIRLIIWAILGVAAAVYAYRYYTDEKLRDSDGPGRFAAMGLAVVFILLIGSALEWLTTRKGSRLNRGPHDQRK